MDLDPEAGGHEDDEDAGSVLEVLGTVVVALLLAWLVQGYLVKPYRIPSGSMENTLRCGDRVLVNRLSYRFGSPHRGDVVVFHPPAAVEHGAPDPSLVAGEGEASPRDAKGNRHVTAADVTYIKRIIGMPGDKVEVRRNHAWVNDKRLKEPYLHPLPRNGAITSDGEWGPYTVPTGTYLMLGDHRDNSADGRVFGFVPRSFVIGKAFMVYWPPQRFGGVPTKDPGGTSDAKPDKNCLESVAGQDH